MNLPESLTEGTKPPEYVETVEALLRMRFFNDEARSEQLYDAIQELEPSDINSRAPAYVQGLRVLATARWQDRQVVKRTAPDLDVGSWNDRWNSSLTMSHVGALASRHEDAIDDICRDLEAVWAAEQPAALASRDELLPLQHLYVHDMISRLAEPPLPIFRGKGMNKRAYWVKGVNGIGPTGFGKTAILGEISHRLQIGKRGEDGKRKRQLIVAPTVQNANQLAGLTGDQTFVRFAKDVSISAFHSASQDLSGDTIATTLEQFVRGFRKGRFFGVPISLLSFDEAHHLTEPLVEETFFREWNGETIGLSATPDYDDPQKDARAILPHTVRHLDILDGIDKKMLNGAQIFTVVADCSDIDVSRMTPKEKREAFKERRDETIANFLAPLLRQGRRTMTFCDAGAQASSAKRMAAMLSQVELPNGRNVVAKPLHSYTQASDPNRTTKVLQQFDAREVDALATVATGIESLNIDVDVITVNGVFSFLKLRQQIGRGTRKSDRFPTTIYAQFLIRDGRDTNSSIPYSVYQGFGLEKIEQGTVLGRNRSKVESDIFSPELQKQMAAINHKTIGEVILGEHEVVEIPSHYIPYGTIPRPEHFSDNRTKRTLDSAGYHWAGTYDRETRTMIRYYEPRAYDHFDRNPVHRRPDKKGLLNIHQVAEHYGVSYYTMRDILTDSGFPTVKKEGANGQATFVKEAFLPSLDQFVESALPSAQPGDISITDLSAELGLPADSLRYIAKVNDVHTRFSRNAPKREASPSTAQPAEDSVSKTRQLLPRKDADVLRLLVRSYPWATPEDRSKVNLAAALGIERLDRLVNYLTEEEKAQRIHRWTNGPDGTPILSRLWSKADGDAIEARLKKELTRPLPAHLVPSLSVMPYLDTRQSNVRHQIRKKTSPFVEKIKLGYDDEHLHTCLSWEQLRQLAHAYGWLADLAIDYRRLPSGPEDVDPEKVSYARFVQATLVEKQKLGFDPEPYLR